MSCGNKIVSKLKKKNQLLVRVIRSAMDIITINSCNSCNSNRFNYNYKVIKLLSDCKDIC